MNNQIIAGIDKYYRYARSIAGNLGDDLLHSILEKIPDNITHVDSYVYRTLRNEWINKDSPFHKLYSPKDYPEIVYEKTDTYDTNLLYTILFDLEREGYKREVRVFKECYFNTNQKEFAKKSGIHRSIVNNICKFVKLEIQKRYVQLDNS